MKMMLRLKICGVLLAVSPALMGQNFKVPTIDSTPVMINPLLTQTSSFGGVNCTHYNAFAQKTAFEFGLTSAANNCQTLLNGFPLPQNVSPLDSQLGENKLSQDTIDEILTKSDPRMLRNPFYSAQNYVAGVLEGPTAGACPAGYQDEDAYPPVNLDISLTAEDRERLLGDLGDQPNWRPAGAQGPLVELPSTGNNIDDQKEAGYYRYNDGDRHVFATDRVTWNIRAAGKILAENNITMGVGELSTQRGPTPGHTEHQGGRDVDLRLIGPRDDEGYARARPCTVHNSSCYDRENTFAMVKAFIDVDPYGIDKVFINDPTLQRMINNYMEEAYGISRVNGSSVARSCGGHDNHVHLSFKNNGTNPDEMARRAQ